MLSKFGAVVLPLIVLLAACGEKTQCGDLFDLRGSVSTLRATESPDSTMRVIERMASSCTRFSEGHQTLIFEALKEIGGRVAFSDQMKFFRELTASNSAAEIREVFIQASPLFAPARKSESFGFVEFEQLGHRISHEELSEAAKAAFKQHGLNLDQLSVKGHLRVVLEGGAHQKIFLAKANDAFGRFVEASYIAAFSESTNRVVKFPTEQLDLVGLEMDQGRYLEYFFSCQSMAGSVCSVRDSRFLTGAEGELRYVVSIDDMADEREERCERTVSVGELKGGNFVSLPGATLEETCASIPTSEGHVLPFEGVDGEKLIEKLRLKDDAQLSELASLINFSRRDSGDTALLKAVLSKGGWADVLRGLEGMAIRPANMASLDAAGIPDGVDRLKAYFDDVERLMVSAEWVAKVAGKTLATDAKLKASSEKVKAALLLARENVARLDLPRPPAKPTSLDLPIRSVTLILEREVFSDDKIEIFSGFPVRYIAREIGRQRAIVLHSEKRLADGPGLFTINVVTTKNDVPSGTYRNHLGFTKDVWEYFVVTAQQQNELNEYSKAKVDFLKRMSGLSVAVRELEPSVTRIAQAKSELLQGLP